MLSCFLSLPSLGVCLGNEMADSLTSLVSLIIFRAVLLVRIPVIYYGADSSFSEPSPLGSPLDEDLIVHSFGVLAVRRESFFLLSALFWKILILLPFITLPSRGSEWDWSKRANTQTHAVSGFPVFKSMGSNRGGGEDGKFYLWQSFVLRAGKKARRQLYFYKYSGHSHPGIWTFSSWWKPWGEFFFPREWETQVCG